MGHQLTRAAAAAAVTFVLAACAGSGGDGDPPPVLDIAREQVDATRTGDGAEPGATEEASGSTEPGTPDELPAPDPSTFEGANRVVNLWVGADGLTAPVDVWGRRTFVNGPILLAEGIEFGAASDYFAAPPGYELVVVWAGAGPDGEERASVANAADGEQITTVFTNDDDQGSTTAVDLPERGTDEAPAPPANGEGLVVLLAANTGAFSDGLTAAIGGDAFSVGDGSPTCRTQRIEATGSAPDVLGGTQQVELELPPGPASISLHPWSSFTACDEPPALELTVDVVAGQTVLVLVYSPDATTIDSLELPVAAS